MYFIHVHVYINPFISTCTLYRDCFIDPDVKPVRSLFQGIRDPYMEDADLPSESLLEVAFDFRRRKLYGLCF